MNFDPAVFEPAGIAVVRKTRPILAETFDGELGGVDAEANEGLSPELPRRIED